MTQRNRAKNVDGASEGPLPRYIVDEGWYEREGRSLAHAIESRIASIEMPQAKPKRRGKAAQKTSTFEDLAKIEGFVSPGLTVLEAVFRLLLVHQNKPMDVDQIGQELAERGIGVRDSRIINPDVLVRMLDRDSYYGFARASGD